MRSWRSFFSRAAPPAPAEGAAAAPPAGPPSGLATAVAPWGNQWPIYSGRFLQENLAVVLACVQAIAGGIASLPCAVYQRTSDGRRVQRDDHPVSRLIRHGPNQLQSWGDFIEWLLASALLQGNAVAVVDHDGAGRPSGLYPVPWWACQPILIPVPPAEAMGSPIVPNSRLVLDVVMTMTPWPLPGARPANGYPIRYFADEVVFLKDRSDDGIIGRSRLSRCPEVLAAGLGAQSFSAGIWANGASLSGILKHPGRLSKEATDNIAASWRETHVGGINAGKIAVVEEGMTYEKIGVSPDDAQLLESRKFTVLEIARIFQLPPPIVGDFSDATFSNTASAREWFAALTLLPWVNKVERAFSQVVFNTDDVSLCFDMAGMIRGDFPQLTSSYVNLVRSGIASADEARLAVGLDPRGGKADELMPQAVGGRPPGTEDGAGDSPSQPGAANGSGQGANGAANAAVH